MSTEETIFELLESSRTNWSVERRELTDAAGNPASHYGLYRKDNNHPLTTVKDSYVIMQNAELAENVVKAASGLASEFKGGLFKGGGKIYYQGKIAPEQVGNDTVKRYITAMNSHDGSASIGFGFSNTVISCQNTFYRALRSIEKFRHTASASDKLKLARTEIQLALTAENDTIENYKRMADTRVSNEVKAKVIADLFNLEVEELQNSVDDVSAVKRNKMAEFGRVMQSEMAQKGETLWGLFNAVTYKTNHIDKTKDKALEFVMIGAGAQKNLSAYRTIVESLPKAYALS